MPSRQSYPREVFMALYTAIDAKLQEHDPPIFILKSNGRQDTIALGVEWKGPLKDKDAQNAAAIIHQTLTEAKKISEADNLNFGKLLYSKWKELQEDGAISEVVIQGKAYNAGLFQFLGFENKAAFLVKYPELKTQRKTSSASNPISSNVDNSYTYYIGVYYSYRSYRVNKFVLAIQYTDKPDLPMQCWQWGFHSKERHGSIVTIPEKVNSTRFEGTATVSGRHLYINLLSPGSNNFPAMQMHLIGISDEVGGDDLKEQEAIPCSLQTISLDQYVVSMEAILLRSSEESAKKLMDQPETYFNHRIEADPLKDNLLREKSLQLYLMLQRRNIRVKFKPNVSDLADLQYRGNLVSKYTERLSGEYRIWNFGLRRGVVIQSKLEISAAIPYQTYFYPYLDAEFKHNHPGLDKQLVKLAISNELRQDQLSFSTYIMHGPTLVNHAIFDIHNMLKKDEWVEGMFITTGYDQKGIIGGYAVMCKVKPGQDCTPSHMTREEAEAYAKGLGLGGMLEALSKLWKRKLWKQKSNSQFACYAVISSPEAGILMVRRDDGPYKGLFDLPGGRLIPGETPDIGLQRCVLEETGVDIQSNVSLWTNQSFTISWDRADGINERLHLIGALYRVDATSIQMGQLDRRAIWIKKGQYHDNAFSDFARMALVG